MKFNEFMATLFLTFLTLSATVLQVLLVVTVCYNPSPWLMIATIVHFIGYGWWVALLINGLWKYLFK